MRASPLKERHRPGSRNENHVLHANTPGNRPRKRRAYVFVALAGKGKYRYYVCSGATDYGKCRTYRVASGFIEAEVARLVSEKALRRENIDRLRAAIARQLKAKAAKPPTDVRELRARVAQLDQQIKRGTENLLLADAADVPAAREILATWRVERQRHQRAITDARVPTATENVEAKVEAAIAQLVGLAGRIRSEHRATARAAFREAVEKVELWWEPRARDLPGFHAGKYGSENVSHQFLI